MAVPPLLVLAVFTALLFDFTNGFHDAANAIATVVATKAMPISSALLLSAVGNLLGALVATGVAQTIAHGLIREVADPQLALLVVWCALLGAIAWNVATWWLGLPSSSSHALIGGLVGAGWMYGQAEQVLWWGVVRKVVLPMLISPVVAGLVAITWLTLVQQMVKRCPPETAEQALPQWQILSGMVLAFSHGSNDAQKSMGVITFALVGAGFLPADSTVPRWVVLACAVAIALGTCVGGNRIIETVGEKICPLDPVSGFVANSAAGVTILLGSALGVPLSSTHVVIGGITGAGYGRSHEVNWQTWRNMVLAWLMTLPGAGVVAGGLFALMGFVLQQMIH